MRQSRSLITSQSIQHISQRPALAGATRRKKAGDARRKAIVISASFALGTLMLLQGGSFTRADDVARDDGSPGQNGGSGPGGDGGAAVAGANPPDTHYAVAQGGAGGSGSSGGNGGAATATAPKGATANGGAGGAASSSRGGDGGDAAATVTGGPGDSSGGASANGGNGGAGGGDGGWGGSASVLNVSVSDLSTNYVIAGGVGARGGNGGDGGLGVGGTGGWAIGSSAATSVISAYSVRATLSLTGGNGGSGGLGSNGGAGSGAYRGNGAAGSALDGDLHIGQDCHGGAGGIGGDAADRESPTFGDGGMAGNGNSTINVDGNHGETALDIVTTSNGGNGGSCYGTALATNGGSAVAASSGTGHGAADVSATATANAGSGGSNLRSEIDDASENPEYTGAAGAGGSARARAYARSDSGEANSTAVASSGQGGSAWAAPGNGGDASALAEAISLTGAAHAVAHAYPAGGGNAGDGLGNGLAGQADATAIATSGVITIEQFTSPARGEEANAYADAWPGLSVGSAIVSTSSVIGGTAAGTFTQTGGTHTATQSVTVAPGSVYGMSDGTLTAPLLNNSGTFLLSGGHFDVPLVSGTGTVVISGAAAATNLGSLTVKDGATLKLNNTVTNINDRIGNSATVTLNRGNLEFVGNLGAPTSETVGALLIGGGVNNVKATAAGSGTTAGITFASLGRTAGLVNFDLTANVNIGFSAGPTLTNGIIGGWATANSTDWATTSGGTVVAYTGYKTTDPTTWLSSDNVSVTAGTTVVASKTVNTFKMASSGNVQIASGQRLTISAGGVLATGTSAASVDGPGTLTAGSSAAAADLITIVPDAAKVVTIGAPISNNASGGTVALVKAGNGKLILDNTSNSYTGGTTIAGGRLEIHDAAVIGGGTVTLAGGQLATVFVNSVDNTIMIAPGTSSSIRADASDLTLNGNFNGSGTITRVGSGSVYLHGNNGTFTGTYVNSAARTRFTSATAGSASARWSFTSSSESTFDFNNGTISLGSIAGTSPLRTNSGFNGVTVSVGALGLNDKYAGAIYDNGSLSTLALNKVGTGTLLLTGTNNYHGGTNVASGTLQIGDGGTIGSIAGNINTSGVVTFNRSNDWSLSGTVAGTGTLIQNGSGTTTVNNVRVGFLAINDGRITVATNGTNTGASVVNAMSIATFAKSGGASTAGLDLTNNDLIVDYSGASPLALVRSLLGAGYHGGAWNGSGGILSSTAVGDGASFGYAEASQLGLTSFDGISLDSSAIVIEYAQASDVNLDGVVDTSDEDIVLGNWMKHGYWLDGDLNYDGMIDQSDLDIVDAGLGRSQVPEPTTMTALMLCAIGIGGRRRRC
jgi:fibronectin-binding autotransporter adhesin